MNQEHYHTIPESEWKSKWLPLEEENKDLRNQLGNQSISIYINRREMPRSGLDGWTAVGYLDLRLTLPSALNIDRSIFGEVLKQHADKAPNFIYSEEHALRVKKDIMYYITVNENLKEDIIKKGKYVNRCMWAFGILLLANLFILYHFYL